MWPRRRKECESKIALAEAQESLERIQQRSPEVSETRKKHERLLERNHFREQLGEIMGRAH